MYCPNCGSEMGEHSKFCSSCGQQIGNNLTERTNAPMRPTVSSSEGYSDGKTKSKSVTLLLALFLGHLGIHRFYVGKIGTGILWLLTVGIFGMGGLVDFILILTGKFKDKRGNYLKDDCPKALVIAAVIIFCLQFIFGFIVGFNGTSNSANNSETADDSNYSTKTSEIADNSEVTIDPQDKSTEDIENKDNDVVSYENENQLKSVDLET